MTNTTEIRIVKRFPDGQTGDVAVGTIDTFGTIVIDRTAPGQEDAVASIVEELNATDIVYDKRIAVMEPEDDPMAPELPDDAALPPEPTVQTTLVKEAFNRGTPEFFPAFIEMTKRFYALELQFDAAALIATIEAEAEAARAAEAEEAAALEEARAAEDTAYEAQVAAAKARAAELSEDEEPEDTEE